MTEQHEAPTGVSGRALQKTSPARDIPQATVTRLATYLRVLAMLADDGVLIVSSEELAVAAGVNSAKLRKDLSFLGPNGVRGVGYDVGKLRTRIEDVLGLSGGHRVVLIGAGNLGRALVGYGGFKRRGFTVVGIFDDDPAVIGRTVAGLTVRDVRVLHEAVLALDPTIAVITVPDDSAQQVCDRLVAAGVQSILSFAPSPLTAPPAVEVRRVDLAVEMQMLSFERTRNIEPEPLASAGAMAAGTAGMTGMAATSGRIAHRSPQTHAALQRTTPHQKTSHQATEPSSKGSVVTP